MQICSEFLCVGGYKGILYLENFRGTSKRKYPVGNSFSILCIKGGKKEEKNIYIKMCSVLSRWPPGKGLAS